eukprot:5439653-Prymnesium_polylepis.1
MPSGFAILRDLRVDTSGIAKVLGGGTAVVTRACATVASGAAFADEACVVSSMSPRFAFRSALRFDFAASR